MAKYIQSNPGFGEFNPQKLEKYRKSLLSKYYSNYAQIQQKYSLEVPGNLSLSLNLLESQVELTYLSPTFHALCFDRPVFSPQEGDSSLTFEGCVDQV